jgi:transposase
LNQDTTGAGAGAGDATLLLGLDGLAVTGVQRGAADTLRVQVATADETAAACPTCGVISTRVKQYVCTRPRDVPQGRTRIELVWRKRRWYCRAPWCGRTSFTESMPAVPAGARITTRLREHAGELVVDGLCATVAAAGRMTGLSWPTAMDAVRAAAARVLDEAPGPVQVLGVDEVRRGRPRWRRAEPAPPPPPAPQPPVTPEPVVPEPVVPEPVVPEPVVPEPVVPEPVVPHRETARARTLADRWHVGFTDIGGGQGMLGQVEGRTADDVAYWLAQHTPAWRDQIRYVAIDMCTVFVAAIRRYLPHATIVVDHFHVVKLANDTVAEVRRRIATQLRGRRGRKTDPEYTVRNLLRRNREDLSDRAFTKLWNTLVDLGDPGLTILQTWIAKEELRRLLALAGTGADRSVISQRLYRFYTWCADAAVPELDRLARTIDTWWPGIEAFLHTKITNAASEGYNRVVKLDARNAYGYRNPENQRLRTRCATTRRARRCLNPDQLR